MKLSRTVDSQETVTSARERIAAYLEAAGYKLVGAEPCLTYRRGSQLASMFSFSPKTYPTTATVEVRPGRDAPTTIVADIEVNTTGQMVTQGMRRFWEQEIDGLVVAVGGRVVEQAANSPQQQLADMSARLRLETRLRNGANWFFWVAGLSMANSVIHLLGGSLSFMIGLGVMQVVDAIFLEIAAAVGPEGALIAKLFALALDAGIAAVVALFGFLARRRQTWIFVVGMVLYGLDGLLLLWVGDLWSVGFHALVLAGLYSGLTASRELRKVAAASV